MQRQVDPHLPTIDVDLIFVLAGLESRKLFGLKLYKQGRAPRLLLSVGRFELREFPALHPPVPIDLLKLAGATPPPLRHFFAGFEGGNVSIERIPVDALGTFYEIRALCAWLRTRPQISSVLVISSAYHLPRLRLCCWAMVPTSVMVRLLSSPSKNSAGHWDEPFWTWSHLRLILSEFFKIPLYLVLFLFGAGRKVPRTGETDHS